MNVQGDISIDDIDRLPQSCQEPNNCDFEDDSFCGWENVKKTDQFDWEITNGPSSATFLSGKLRAIEKIPLHYLTDL
jgi:hypothetical protein